MNVEGVLGKKEGSSRPGPKGLKEPQKKTLAPSQKIFSRGKKCDLGHGGESIRMCTDGK